MEEPVVLLLIVVEVLLEDASWMELTEAINNKLVVVVMLEVALDILLLGSLLGNEPRSDVVVVMFKVALDALLGSVMENADVVRLSMFPRLML